MPFDAERAEATGPERKLLDGVMTHFTGAAQFTVAANGTLAYIAGSVAPREDALLWVDRQGTREPLLDNGRVFMDPRLSPDGTRLAVASPESANYDIWLFHLARHTLTRLTSHPGEDFHPVWSPDGKRLAFASEIGEGTGEQGPRLVWLIPGSNEPPEQLLHTPPAEGTWDIPTSWSLDGRYLAFTATRDGSPDHIDLLPTSGAREPIAFSTTPASETAAMFSPDGRWLAYMSDDSGRDEIYVRPFPGPGERIQMSTEGGVEPLWARDGHELFYREGNKMMVVRVTAGASLAASAPKPLFEGRFQKTQRGASVANYDVSPDGRRFVMVRRKNLATPTAIDVVFNWPEALQARALGAAR